MSHLRIAIEIVLFNLGNFNFVYHWMYKCDFYGPSTNYHR